MPYNYGQDYYTPHLLLRIIPFNKIMWNDKHKYTNIEKGSRYEQADIRFPGIVKPYPINSYGEIYFVVDGNHRIQKMIDQGIDEGLFFITDGIDNTTNT